MYLLTVTSMCSSEIVNTQEHCIWAYVEWVNLGGWVCLSCV